MKKKLISLMLLICCSVTLTGCFGRTYLSEKLFWYAHRAATEKIWKDPQKATPADYAAVIEGYEKVIDRTPGTTLAGRSQFLIAQLYLMQKEYDKAQNEFTKVVQNYFETSSIASEAQFAIGFCHEAQGDWEKAKVAYRVVYDQYPLTVKGLQTPLYIAAHYTRDGDAKGAADAYKAATNHYKDLVRDTPIPQQTLLAQAFLANTFAAQQEWQDAAQTLDEMVTAHPDFPNAPVSLFNAAMIYKTKLNEPDTAHQMFERFLAAYPQHALAELAQSEVNSLKSGE